MRRIFAKIAAVICVCMVVGGCSVRDGMAGAFGMRIVSPESAELDDVIAAIALNPSSKKFETIDKGYVALVHSNGRTEYIQTKGMLQQHIVWNDTGVFFQDQKHDYLISNEHGKGYVKDRQETFGTQWASVSVAHDAVITVYDAPFTDRPNFTLQWFTPEPDASLTLEGEVPQAIAQCTSGTYAVSQDTTATNLYRIDNPRSGRKVASVASLSVPKIDLPQVVGAAPCINDELLLLGTSPSPAYKEDIKLWNLIKWNVKTHTLTSTEVIDFAKDVMRSQDDNTMRYGAGLTVGDQLTVFLESGAIETVNTTTSHIDHQHFHLPDSLGNDSYPLSRTLLAKGIGGFATVIAVPTDGHNRCKILVYKLYESDIQNLDSVYAIDTDGKLNEMLSGTTDYLPTDFAPNPRMHWKTPDTN